MPKKKGKKPSSGGGGGSCSTICEILAFNHSIVLQNPGWSLEISIFLNDPTISTNFTITNVDLVNCTITGINADTNESTTLNCEFVEINWNYYIVNGFGAGVSTVSFPCNVICSLLEYNFQQLITYGWSDVIIRPALTPTRYRLTNVNIPSCEISGETLLGETTFIITCPNFEINWSEVQVFR
jgi:hypothetical protein